MAEMLSDPQPAAFLAEAARKPFVWGYNDCFLFAADWIVACGHCDPAREWRGTYHNAFGAFRLLHRSGGAVALARAAMAGFDEYDPATIEPRDGDVSMVEGGLEHRKGQPWWSNAAAVRVGRLWVVRTTTGLVGNCPPLLSPIVAWRLA